MSSRRYLYVLPGRGRYDDQDNKMRDVILDDFYASLPLEE